MGSIICCYSYTNHRLSLHNSFTIKLSFCSYLFIHWIVSFIPSLRSVTGLKLISFLAKVISAKCFLTSPSLGLSYFIGFFQDSSSAIIFIMVLIDTSFPLPILLRLGWMFPTSPVRFRCVPPQGTSAKSLTSQYLFSSLPSLEARSFPSQSDKDHPKSLLCHRATHWFSCTTLNFHPASAHLDVAPFQIFCPCVIRYAQGEIAPL